MKIILAMLKRFFTILAPRLEQRSAYHNMHDLCWDCTALEGGVNLVTFRFREENTSSEGNKLVDLLASFLTYFITNDVKELLLDDLIRQYYFYFRTEERLQILALAGKILGSGNGAGRQETFRLVIERKLGEYLREETYLNLEGFINFRLRDYRRELKRVVDAAVENFLMEKEYREFIRLLKYFLELQEPKIDIIHLALDGQGQFQITDQRFRRIDPGDWEEFSLEEIEDEREYEDLLVSMLVTVAPRRVLLHQNVLPRYPRAVETLKRIFGTRLISCHNCSYCRQDNFHVITGDKS